MQYLTHTCINIAMNTFIDNHAFVILNSQANQEPSADVCDWTAAIPNILNPNFTRVSADQFV